MEEVQKKKRFCDKFLITENIDSIDDEDVLAKFVGRFVIMFALLSVMGWIFTFLGYNFEHNFPKYVFCFSAIAFLLGLLAYIKLVEVASKNKFFKEGINAYLFFLPIIVYSVIVAVSAIFTAHFTPSSDINEMSWTVQLNPFFFFIIYIPLFIGLNFFYSYACIAYVAKRYRVIHKQNKLLKKQRNQKL